jgi:hypothetical protein
MLMPVLWAINPVSLKLGCEQNREFKRDEVPLLEKISPFPFRGRGTGGWGYPFIDRGGDVG